GVPQLRPLGQKPEDVAETSEELRPISPLVLPCGKESVDHVLEISPLTSDSGLDHLGPDGFDDAMDQILVLYLDAELLKIDLRQNDLAAQLGGLGETLRHPALDERCF